MNAFSKHYTSIFEVNDLIAPIYHIWKSHAINCTLNAVVFDQLYICPSRCVIRIPLQGVTKRQTKYKVIFRIDINLSSTF